MKTNDLSPGQKFEGISSAPSFGEQGVVSSMRPGRLAVEANVAVVESLGRRTDISDGSGSVGPTTYPDAISTPYEKHYFDMINAETDHDHIKVLLDLARRLKRKKIGHAALGVLEQLYTQKSGDTELL